MEKQFSIDKDYEYTKERAIASNSLTILNASDFVFKG